MADRYDKLNKRHVLIFGGSSGIGYSVAEACLASSARVTISGSNNATTESAAAKLLIDFPSARVSGISCELSQPADLEDRLLKLFRSTGRVDHIVFCSGDAHNPQRLALTSYDTMLVSGQVRFFAAVIMAKIALPFLRPGPDSSLTFTNGYVFQRPVQGWVQETAWAGALDSVTRSLAAEMAPIRVNLVSVGVADT